MPGTQEVLNKYLPHCFTKTPLLSSLMSVTDLGRTKSNVSFIFLKVSTVTVSGNATFYQEVL